METFHFALNNTVTLDNRIPPYGMDYNEAERRQMHDGFAARYPELWDERWLENSSVIAQLTDDSTRPPSYFALEAYLFDLAPPATPPSADDEHEVQPAQGR